MSKEPDILTVKQAAERWQLNPESLRRMCERKEVVAFKVGKVWRIPRKENECAAK